LVTSAIVVTRARADHDARQLDDLIVWREVIAVDANFGDDPRRLLLLAGDEPDNRAGTAGERLCTRQHASAIARAGRGSGGR
jgi:hypothetical protein